MDWARDGEGWPNREHSQFHKVRPHFWHVQDAGEGPVVLLLHGTGGATHSWRDLLPLLAREVRVIAPDLPGHGFTFRGTRQRSGLHTMAQDLWALCEVLEVAPHAIVGHSAGGALACRMALAPGASGPPAHVVGINAALGAFQGPAQFLFPAAARMLALVPGVPSLATQLARSPGQIANLLRSTGSEVDEAGRALYARCFCDADHVAGALDMMAQWNLSGMGHVLSGLPCPLTLLVGERDGTVPPDISREAARRAPEAEVTSLGSLGHLAHEEDPEAAARAILAAIA